MVAQSLILKFNKLVDEKQGKLEIGIKEDKRINDLMTAKVYEFPFIGLVWIGVIIMVFGILMSMVQRIKKNKLSVV